MKLIYEAYYRTKQKTIRIIHGELSQEDIEECIRAAEDRDSLGHSEVMFESANVLRVEM